MSIGKNPIRLQAVPLNPIRPDYSQGFFDQPKGASPMALTLCFREPVGASPGPEFAGEFA